MSSSTAVAFIVARLGSSRFSGKQLRTIGSISILQWIVDSLRQCRQLDRIVLATVAAPENEPLQAWARDHQVDCFWYQGATDHVTTRLRTAAEHYAADICILISADCPLIDPAAVDSLILNLKAHPEADYVVLPQDREHRACMLQGVVAATRDCWQRADDLSDRPELKEHQFPVLAQRPDLFTPLPCRLDPALYGQYHRLSVDTWSDLSFFNQVFALLAAQGQEFTLGNAVALLNQHPELKAINGHVHQKQLIEQTQRLLIAFSMPPGPDIFTPAQHLALQIIDRLGWPVTMLNADGYGCQLQETGIRTVVMSETMGGAMHSRFDLMLLVLVKQHPSWWEQLPEELPRLCLHCALPAQQPMNDTLPLSRQPDEATIVQIIASLKALSAGMQAHG